MSGYLLVLCAAVLWGLIGPLSKFVFAEGITPLEVAFWRSVIGWGLFAAQAALRGAGRAQTRDLPILAAFGLVGVSLFYGSYQVAIGLVGAALSSVLLYTAPAWVALLSRLVLGESMSAAKLAAVAATIFGVACVSLSGGGTIEPSALGVLGGLTAGFTYALYYIFGKKYLGRYGTVTIFLYALPVGALGLWPFVHFAHKSATAWAFLILLSATTTWGAYSVYYAGLRRLEATRAAVVATLEPVMAAWLAWWWWDERFGPAGYLGSGLILSAVLLMVAEGARRGRGVGEPA